VFSPLCFLLDISSVLLVDVFFLWFSFGVVSASVLNVTSLSLHLCGVLSVLVVDVKFSLLDVLFAVGSTRSFEVGHPSWLFLLPVGVSFEVVLSSSSFPCGVCSVLVTNVFALSVVLFNVGSVGPVKFDVASLSRLLCGGVSKLAIDLLFSLCFLLSVCSLVPLDVGLSLLCFLFGVSLVFLVDAMFS